MTGRPRALLLAAALACAWTALPAGVTLEGHAGFRSLEENDFLGVELEALEDDLAFGAALLFGPESLPVEFAVGIHLSPREERESFGSFTLDETMDYREVSFGFRKTWEPGGRMRPFAGGGVARNKVDVRLEQGFQSFSDSDDDTGFYMEGGVHWTLGRGWHLGGMARVLESTSLKAQGEVVPSDYVQVGLVAGWTPGG